MSAVAQPVNEPITIDLSRFPRPSFARLVGVELRKSYDTRAGFWLIASMGILTVLVLSIMTIVGLVQDVAFNYGDFTGASAFVTSILLPVLGILLVTSEWSQRTAMTTFTLESHRARVILAKLVTGVLLAFAVAVFAMAAGALASALYALLGGDLSWDFGFKYLVGFLITQSLAMLSGFALATLILNSPASIVAFFAYKWMLPIIFAIGSQFIGWFADFSPWIDFQQAQTPVADLSVNGSEWGHLLVSGLFWLALPLGLGLWRVLRAEVK